MWVAASKSYQSLEIFCIKYFKLKWFFYCLTASKSGSTSVWILTDVHKYFLNLWKGHKSDLLYLKNVAWWSLNYLYRPFREHYTLSNLGHEQQKWYCQPGQEHTCQPSTPAPAVTAAAAQPSLFMGLHTQSPQPGQPGHLQGFRTQPVQCHSPRMEATELAWCTKPNPESLKQRENQHQTKPFFMPPLLRDESLFKLIW